jgi:hypothetical protein
VEAEDDAHDQDGDVAGRQDLQGVTKSLTYERVRDG